MKFVRIHNHKSHPNAGVVMRLFVKFWHSAVDCYCEFIVELQLQATCSLNVLRPPEPTNCGCIKRHVT